MTEKTINTIKRVLNAYLLCNEGCFTDENEEDDIKEAINEIELLEGDE